MKGKKLMKRIIALFISIVVMLALCACNNPEVAQPTNGTSVNDKTEFSIPEVGEAGGYTIATETIEIIAYTTGNCKYVEMSTKDGSVLQCYITPTKMIIVDKKNGETTYYQEEFNSEQKYTNPLTRIFGSMKNMDFKETSDGSGIYKAEVKTEQEVSKVIKYNRYTMKMTWKDGNEYIFEYLDYANGENIVSADAPDAINPAITKDTTWIVDVENCIVKDTASGETIPFTVTHVVSEEGVSPSGAEKETVTKEFTVELYVNEKFDIETVRYISTNLDLTIGILYNYTMTEPTIPDGAREMTTDEAQDAIFRVYAAESII